MKRYFKLREFKLLDKNTISGPEATWPTQRFRFDMPNEDLASCDLGRGDIVKLCWQWQIGQIPRSYNPLFGGVGGSSSDLDTFDLVVKIYGDRDGAAAWLDKVKVGETVRMSGPFPQFPEIRTRNEGGSEVGIVCYGVAITEAIAVADAELRREDVKQVALLWANRKRDDRSLVDELLILNRQHPSRLMVKQIFSEESGGDLHGHVNADILRDVFSFTEQANVRFHVVGSKKMYNDTWAMLESSGYSHQENELLHEQTAVESICEMLARYCCCCTRGKDWTTGGWL